MLKKLGVFALLLVASGIGLSLYLPKHLPVEQPTSTFNVAGYSIDQAVDLSTIQLSSLLSSNNSDNNIQYALQLSQFESLSGATSEAELLGKKEITFPSLPTIFRVTAQNRYWYILMLGPFKNRNEAILFQRQLENTHTLPSVTVLWPTNKDAEKS